MTSKDFCRNKRLIPYGRQTVTPEDRNAVLEVLKSDWLTQGPVVRRFEKLFADYCEVPYAVAVSSGTAALHLACLAAGFGKSDEVITSPMTFVATANAVLYTGAEVVFADVDGRTLGLDPAALHRKITRRTKGVINVHFGGHPSRIGPKKNFSKKKDFYVIEDACHALGAKYLSRGRWKKIGCCDEADMSAFSFHPVKHITTGEGGMITTRSKTLYEKLLLLRSHGIEKNPQNFLDKKATGRLWYYEMQMLGFNYRITDFQCALGISQLSRLGPLLTKRRKIASYYACHLKDLADVHLPKEMDGAHSSYHLYPLRVDFARLRTSRETVMKALRERGIGTQVHYIPLINQPYYRDRYGENLEEYPECARFYREALSIPLFPSMTRSDSSRVVASLKDVLTR